MKRNYTEKTVNELTSIEAFDGTKFFVNNKVNEEQAIKECYQYENTALNVTKKRIQDFKIGETNVCCMDETSASEEYVEIYKPESDDDVKNLMMYVSLKKVELANEITFKKNEEVILIWNYDETWVTVTTLEAWVGSITKNYYKIIEEYKERKNG